MYETELLSDVQYGEGDGHPLFLDIVRPLGAPAHPLPVIVYIHGGGWMFGDKAASGGKLNSLYAKQGFFTVSLNHRPSKVAPFPAQIHDVKAAIRWLRANADTYGIDPNAIGVWGHSSGGHLAALLATSGDVPELEGNSGSPGYSSRVQAACVSAGPVDLLRMGGWHDLPDSPEAVLLNAKYAQDNPDLAKVANPITYINGDEPPVLILHGDQDCIVPVNQAELLFHALTDVSLVRIKGGDHDDYNGGNLVMDDVLHLVLSFMKRNLLGPKPTPEEVQARREPMERAVQSMYEKAEQDLKRVIEN
ncbi:alpha/beta hydrolase [Tumebacillus flagellatus]|uniref:BD-FAE-like domain-containing protein n=1 Tax=Tumebacillus flagellatus TaxID=1157490 RepID=A0A074M5C8_9BACL|nr:alpha/beta hydrolase [Tumebacillus flagellatus]KEO81182.1 hypothetical protein EL26_22260 [Tumebacillus flagellatus]